MVNQSTQSPFTVGAMVTNPDSFIGRRDAVNFIIRNMTNDQPVSLNVVGDRKYGKSSLLNYVSQVYETLVASYGKDGREFVVVYLSAQELSKKRRCQLYQRFSEKLEMRPWINANPRLHQAMQVRDWTEDSFRSMLEVFQTEGVLPVFCLDDIEELLELSEEFTNDFYDFLRSLLNQRLIMMVLASRQKLPKYKRKYKKTSDFFNVVQFFQLQEFTDGETADLLRLPSPSSPVLGEEKQKLASSWGGRHPCRLQLAAESLFLAQVQQHDDAWAKQHFQQQLQNVGTRKSGWINSIKGIETIGAGAQWIGDQIDDASNFVKGLSVLLAFGLFLTGVMNFSVAIHWFQSNVIEDITGTGD